MEGDEWSLNGLFSPRGYQEHHGLRKFDRDGFWGAPSATIDWCESNYELTHFVAEFWNTISNVFLLWFAIKGFLMCKRENLSSDLKLLFLFNATIGIGSAAFHGTLLKTMQQLDETPMVLAITQWLYILFKRNIPKTLKVVAPYVVVGHDVVFAICHAYFQSVTPFQIYFTIMVLISALRLLFLYENDFKENSQVRRLIRHYFLSMLIGVGFWLSDQHLCEQMQTQMPFNPQGHAWWHLFTGYAAYVGPTALAFYLAKEIGGKPRVCYDVLMLPYVEIQNKHE